MYKRKKEKVCIVDVNNKVCNVYVSCVMDARWEDLVVGIFLTNLCFSDIFLSNQKLSILLFYFTVIFIHFYNVFGLDSLNPRTLAYQARWRVRSYILLEYNNENMRFIRLLLANQIAYIFFQ